MAESESTDSKTVERKLIIYKTLVDPAVVKVAGEKLKNKLFVRFGFLKPKSEEIQFVSIDKYYEPYIVVSGNYLIDYYRRSTYTVNVDAKVREVIMFNHKLEPELSKESSAKGYKLIKLEGEEHLLYEDKASLILDKTGREVLLEQLPSAPSEENPKRMLTELGENARKLEMASDADVGILRSKIAGRPKGVKRIVRELFEIKERTLIYTPIYRVLFQNMKSGEVKALEFDGVTSKRIS